MKTINSKSSGRTQAVILVLITAILFVAWLTIRPNMPPPELRQGTLLTNPKIIRDFNLVDHTGAAFTKNSLTGHWTFAFFGYTHCPDVCPTALTMMAQVQRSLEKTLAPDDLPQMTFFSVDPDRDTPELLADFVPFFHNTFIGVTGEAKQINLVTRQIGILYLKSDQDGGAPEPDQQDYLMDHSAVIILFDPNGNFRALFNVPHDPKFIEEDFLAIKEYFEANQ